ncbi:hypothetical protein [Taibaiella soli]|uniref:hypothetical protein n=1 Tax=Taibaiella soli TaxID=1649169 RepID=UPI000F51520C|nr:hypothetical protein [Taibaiella soli]
MEKKQPPALKFQNFLISSRIRNNLKRSEHCICIHLIQITHIRNFNASVFGVFQLIGTDCVDKISGNAGLPEGESMVCSYERIGFMHNTFLSSGMEDLEKQ